MVMYAFIADSSNPDTDTEHVIWSNQKGFNYLQIEGAAEFDPDIEYPNPPYVRSSTFGVTSASAKVKHTKLDRDNGTRYTTNEENYPCEQREGRGIVEYWNCTATEPRFDRSITHADEIEVTLTFTSGGNRELLNPDNNRIERKDNYTQLTSSKSLRFKFDLTKPAHCFGETSCNTSPLSLDRDITRTPVSIKWEGWTDSLSGMHRYAWEVFRLDTTGGKLREKKPLEPLVNREWLVKNGTFPVTYTPPAPGMYSVILEASDLANNSCYARRLFLYDDASNVSVSVDDPLFISSAAAATNYRWQASLNADVVVNWTGHFSNQVHHKSNLLNAVADYPPQFTDIERETASSTFTVKRIQFDDDDGARTRNAIPNIQGIVKFEVAYRRDHYGGFTILGPEKWQQIALHETFTIQNEARINGDTIRVWVRATDIMNSTRTDSTLVSFDASEPTVQLKKLTKNVQNGTYHYSSLVSITAFDEDSGIQEVTWRLLRSSTRKVTRTGTLSPTDYRLNEAECEDHPGLCRKTPSKAYFRDTFSLPINHCWLSVEKKRLTTEVIILNVTVTNAAMLSTTRSRQIENINTFSGIGEYPPPRDVRVIRSGFNTVRISWVISPSCYDVTELWINYPGAATKEKIHRDRTYYDVTGLQPEYNYTAYLRTGYSGEMSDPVEFRFRTGPIPTSTVLTVGGITGVTISVVLLLVIAVAVFLLWHLGIIAVIQGKKEAKPRTQAANAFARMSRKVRGTAVDDDIYVYSGNDYDIPIGVQLSSARLVLDTLITEGKFAKVHKATLSRAGGNAETVVAKMLKENYNDEDLQLMKGKILFYLNEVGEHRNILRMLGAVVDNDVWGPVMVLEYCEIGPMKLWLVQQKGTVNDEVLDRMFQLAHGVVQGMAYLARVGIVHRRLAARNILLTFLLEVRIAGFGPTIMTDDGDDEASDPSTRERIPLRWMAPECFKSTRGATEKSDVWSFGVVLWEIFSLGENPYPGIKTSEVPQKVKAGHRMPRPEFADDINYDLMQRCWEQEPRRRPKFRELEKSYNKVMRGGHTDNTYPTYSSIYKR
ncbi:ephrin type-A receptor 5-like [Haliotis asinina]|uniref:ephrin type-A receptor 5-like n=1 Tax=Haliotis asinina TaxID=109174 RepID=UPI0035325C21